MKKTLTEKGRNKKKKITISSVPSCPCDSLKLTHSISNDTKPNELKQIIISLHIPQCLSCNDAFLNLKCLID